MFTTTVVLLRFAFSWIVQFCTGFPVPSFSTPEIFTAIFTPQINILRHSRRFFKCAYKALLPAAP
ncbi:hypothetical protein AWF26_08160 [Escherichia coli]|nr:hypothetical protein AWF26_08160 [Escherichia coli]